jgi:hypothetical protein
MEAAGFLPSGLKEPTLLENQLFPLVFNESWHTK